MTPATAPRTDRAALPPAARRWLDRAVAPGAEGLVRAELRMHGEILVGRWRPFRARQRLDPGAGTFVWAATAGRGPLAIRGWDRLEGGAGEMRWRVLGVPVMRARGEDVTRSAAGRLAGEIVLCPAAALDPRVRWDPSDDGERATFRVRIGRWEHEVTVTVDAAGAVAAVDLPRWGDPHGTGHALHGFHVACADEVTAQGITIPRHVRAGWRDAGGAVRDFFRAEIDGAAFR